MVKNFSRLFLGCKSTVTQKLKYLSYNHAEKHSVKNNILTSKLDVVFLWIYKLYTFLFF